MFEKTQGTIQDVAGKVLDAAGNATDDPGLQAEGKVRQAAGKLQQTYGAALEGLRDAAGSNPVTTLAVVAGVGFLFGVLWARRD